jgi:hydroxymethylbilane synthase
LEIELLPVLTRGDLQRQVPLTELVGEDGVFTRGVEAELIAGRADLAVHSLKDLPTQGDQRLVLAAFPPRADARDVLVSRQGASLADLPAGAVVGTGSPRRAAQLLLARSDLRVVSVRGNVDTRLAKLAAGEVDALVLAAAGLARLKRLELISEHLDLERFTPAVGQGALVTAIDSAETRAAVNAERAFLRAVGGGCRLPLGAYGSVADDRIELIGFLAYPDASQAHRLVCAGPASEPERLGRELASRLLAQVDPATLAEARRD